MKKPLLLLFAAFALFTACTKNDDVLEAPPEKTYPVSFSASSLSSVIKPYSKSAETILGAGDTLQNYADYFEYMVFKSDGTYIRTRHQHYTQWFTGTFGTITDHLPPGSYTAVLFAYTFFGSTTSHSNTLSSLFIGSFDPSWRETYVKRIDFTVGASQADQNVQLERVGGGIEINVEDAIPQHASSISVQVSEDVRAYCVTASNHTYTPKTKTFPLNAQVKGVKNSKYRVNVCNTFKPFSVTIRALDSAGAVIAQKVVGNIQCYQNKITPLSGNLFTAVNGSVSVSSSRPSTAEPNLRVINF